MKARLCMPDTWRDRVMRKVSFEPNMGCWIWTGASNDSGYGCIGIGHRNVLAHRAVFILENGREAVGLLMHSCDVRLCVNPGHLREGSPSENYHDMVQKNRHNALSRSFEKMKKHSKDSKVAAVSDG